MTAGPWAEEALGLLIARAGETAVRVGDRFPLYADPDDGRWTTTGRGSWTGGFWAGLLHLRAGHTGIPADRAAAGAATARLAPWADADTATRGLILWYGTALAAGDGTADALRERAARAVLAAWDPRLGLVPWGAALGGPRLRARADGVPGLVPLLASAGPEGRTAAAAHLDRHLELCLPPTTGPRSRPARPRPAWRLDEDRRAAEADRVPDRWSAVDSASGHRVVEADRVPDRWSAADSEPGHRTAGADRARGRRSAADSVPGHRAVEADRVRGRRSVADRVPRPRPVDAVRAYGSWTAEADPAPGWTRGEAWLLLAVADALLLPDVRPRWSWDAERLLEAGEFLTGPLVPPAEAHRPDGPLDTSAAAVAATALLKLALVPGFGRAAACAARAEAVLRALTAAHLTRPGGPRPPGMLLDGCYDAHAGTAVRHELVWGDFFLALGLSALLGRTDLRRV
ncbi:sugar ABC transporter permease [Streptomyces sp. NPDC101490]|uniref:sugar ABC transporter permease n=1 Tax=Streptomyces sp. NPDC101490 TaxID=3366143 RepID=UPI00380981D0